MNGLNQNITKKVQSSPEEQDRIRKNFLEELELLRGKEIKILKKLGLRTRKTILADNQNGEFSFEKSLEVFLKELDGSEKELYKQKGALNQAALDQGSSKLRILREKARTLLANTKTGSQEINSQEVKSL